MRPRARIATLCLAGLLAAGGIGAWTAYNALRDLPQPDLERAETARVILDRKGKLLNAALTTSGHWRLPVSLEDVDPDYVRLLLAYEDQRFHAHHGVDWRAMVRAAWQMVTNGQIVSGGSTISMQLARLTGERGPRSLSRKLRQMAQALRLEDALGKTDILERYLTRAPFGGNIEGVRAASLIWFGKEPRHLTLAEAALLVALPQSPEARRPDRSPEAARAARGRVLDRALVLELATPEQIARARAAPIPGARLAMPRHAPLTVQRLYADLPPSAHTETVIDRELQTRLQRTGLEAARRWGARTTAAIVVVDNATGNVLARIANAAYGQEARFGAVDMAAATRSPGSALKPFVYALAFERGHVRPATLIDDRPTRFGGWTPENFAGEYQGPVSVSEALQFSLNVPAVLLAERIGPASIAARLAAAGHPLVLPEGARPALPIVLGGAGISLDALASLYAGLARGGRAPNLRIAQGNPVEPAGDPVTIPDVARMLAGILREAPAPQHAATGRISFKTGTSYGYRDAWAVGFDRYTTIAVWIGRADASPVPGLAGRDAAAPLLFDAFARLGRPIEPVGDAPDLTGGDLPPPLRRFVRRAELVALAATPPPRIAYPPDGGLIEPSLATPGSQVSVPIRITGGLPPFTVLANGKPVHRGIRRSVSWGSGETGFSRIVVVDAAGRRSIANIRIDAASANGHVLSSPPLRTNAR